MLPEAFTDRMQEMLSAEEYQAFLKSYGEPKKQALRLNPLKGDSGRFLELCPFSLTRVPWEENGYYFDSEDRPGKHPFHEAGVYYIRGRGSWICVRRLAVRVPRSQQQCRAKEFWSAMNTTESVQRSLLRT